MIINICGASGQGKSQVLSHLKEEGYQVESLFSESMRPKSVREFCSRQNDLLVYRDTLIAEYKKSNKNTPLIIESSFIDMFVYSLLIVGISSDYKEWIDQYYDLCIQAQRNVDVLINLPLNSSEDTSLPFFTANSFNVLTKHYQEEVIDSCNIVSIDVKSSDKSTEEYFEEICEQVDGVIKSNDNRVHESS